MAGEDLRPRAMSEVARDPLYRRHRFPAEIIAYAVLLYFRFPLSARMVEDMLAPAAASSRTRPFGAGRRSSGAGVNRHREMIPVEQANSATYVADRRGHPARFTIMQPSSHRYRTSIGARKTSGGVSGSSRQRDNRDLLSFDCLSFWSSYEVIGSSRQLRWQSLSQAGRRPPTDRLPKGSPSTVAARSGASPYRGTAIDR